MLGSGQDNEMFSGHFFRDMVAKRSSSEKGSFDLVGAFSPLLDAQMAQHKVNNEIHASRVNELLDIEKRIKATA